VLTDSTGTIVQSMSFDPWGQRRNAQSWAPLAAGFLTNFDHSKTTKGYTGHEQLDEVGLIHMNGRIYDPRLARFLQADPHIQAPSDTQMLNRYSYVRNNPLNATDPSGYFLTLVVGIMLAAAGTKLVVAAVIIGFTAMMEAKMAGASWSEAFKAGVIAGVSAYAFGRIGKSFGSTGSANFASDWGGSGVRFYNFGGNYLTAGQVAGQIAAHGAVGGVTASLQGGNFGHGFFSAGFTKGVMGAANFNSVDPSFGAVLGQTTVAAVVGGTVSHVTGGKFANGARTAAYGHLFNGLGKYFFRAAAWVGSKFRGNSRDQGRGSAGQSEFSEIEESLQVENQTEFPSTRQDLHDDLINKGFEYKGTNHGGYATYKGPDGTNVTVKPSGEVIRTQRVWNADKTSKFPQRQDYNGNALPDQSHLTGHFVEPFIGPISPGGLL